MIYTHHFLSPLGEMLMAGDDKGLSGLWFCGQKYFGLGLDPEHKEKPCLFLIRQSSGSRFIFPERNLIFQFLFISQEQISKKKYGSFSAPFPMGRLQPTAKLPADWPCKKDCPTCPLRL